MHKLSNFKSKDRTRIKLNNFRSGSYFKVRYILSVYSHLGKNLYGVSDRLNHGDALSDMNAEPFKLSKETRHLKLRDFNCNYDVCVCGRWCYDITDQTSRLLFMLYGGFYA